MPVCICVRSEGHCVGLQNPKKSRAIGLSEKADFGEKQKLFGGYAWIPVEVASLYIGLSIDLDSSV